MHFTFHRTFTGLGAQQLPGGVLVPIDDDKKCSPLDVVKEALAVQ